jgi:hypothetical protein
MKLWLCGVMACALVSGAGAVSAPRAATRSETALCPRTVVGFVNSLNVLDGRLDIGVTYDGYGNLLGRVRVAYGRIAVRTESAACTSRVGVPGERAMNAYIRAYNSWSDCLDWYNSAVVQNRIDWGANVPTCEKGPGHGYAFRQRQWRAAHANVRRAIEALG